MTALDRSDLPYANLGIAVRVLQADDAGQVGRSPRLRRLVDGPVGKGVDPGQFAGTAELLGRLGGGRIVQLADG